MLYISRIRPYNNFVTDLPDLVKTATKVLIPNQFVYTGGSSYAVYNAVSLLCSSASHYVFSVGKVNLIFE